MPLAFAAAGVMNQKNRDALSPELQEPSLHLIPALGIVFSAAVHQRRDIIEDQEIDRFEQRLDCCLMMRQRQIERCPEFLPIHGQKLEEIRVRWLASRCCYHGLGPLLQQLLRHFPVDKEDAARSGGIPSEKGLATGHRPSDVEGNLSLTDAARGKQHGQAALGKNWRQYVLAVRQR